MCHHYEERTEAWRIRREAETDDDSEDETLPSFANDETDVDIDLLEADD